MSDIRIPVYRPDLNGNEKKYVLDCIETTWISSKGKYVERFEEEFSKFTNIKYAASVSNGTVALHVALLALGIGPGDEVIVPSFTYIASVNAITYTGAKPIFVDSEEKTWQMDPGDIEKKITRKTRAIMVVHLYGHPCEMDRITKIARNNKLRVVEDCAEGIGTYYNNKHVGSFGDIATFSFFGNKTITTGEGGMVLSNNLNLAETARHLKGQGLAKNREYWHDIIGYNYRMTNICAALGVAQLERIDSFVKRKKEIAKLYKVGVKNLHGVIFHETADMATHSYWMCSILLSDEAARNDLRKALLDSGIETRPFFSPVHKMPMYESGQSFPVAESLASRGINLPSWPGMTDKDVLYVIENIKKFIMRVL